MFEEKYISMVTVGFAKAGGPRWREFDAFLSGPF